MLSPETDNNVLIAFCVFFAFSLLLTICLLLIRSADDYQVTKFFTAIIYGLHAGIALEAFDVFRTGGGMEYGTMWEFATSQGLHGIAVSLLLIAIPQTLWLTVRGC